MKFLARALALGALVLFLLPSLGWTQASTDFSEMEQWVKDSEHQPDVPIGTKITVQNYQQYKQVLPLGMIKLFEGQYFWKMPPDAVLEVGPTHLGSRLPSFQAATEKYSSQVQVKVLPNGHYQLLNFQGGVPFPNPTEPNKGWKALANIYYAYVPAMYFNGPENYGTVWAVDKYGNISPYSNDVVYTWTAYNTDPGFEKTRGAVPGTWYTEWVMQETPEQARYTTALQIFFIDQETNPYPDLYVFVPALRRSLRLSTTARCSPYLGYDWTYDDGKTNGFNGTTSIFTGDYLGDRKILTLAVFDQEGAVFPDGYLMPLGFPKPSWGKWELRPMAVVDVHRIPSESAGYCYRHRVMYAEKELWNGDWVDLFDNNNKLWKSISYYNDIGNVPGLGWTWDGVASSAMDFQNAHQTVWSGFGNPWKRKPMLDNNAPKEYFNRVKYGSPAGLMQIMK
jgi:hypothetical protein